MNDGFPASYVGGVCLFLGVAMLAFAYGVNAALGFGLLAVYLKLK